MKEKLKIFIVGPAYPLRGGPAQFNENYCKTLRQEGHEAHIISYSLQYPSFLFPGTSQYEQSGSAPESIPIHTLINTVNPFNWLRVARFIRKEKPDLVIFRFWLPFFGPSLGSIIRLVKWRKPEICMVALTDNVVPHEKRPGDRLFTRYFLKACDGFITMSKKVLEDLTTFTDNTHKAYAPHPMYETYGAKISQDEARRKLGLGEQDKIVLFFGLIRRYKGLDLLLEAMGDERVKKENIRLLVAGEFYEEPEYYTGLIEKLNLEKNVILHTHFIPNEDVRYYFCAANLIAQTYRNATNSGVSMIGYYYEKPMLVTRVGGLSEIVPHQKAGYSVAPESEKIAEHLHDYFSKNREPAFTMGIIEEKKKYEWSSFVEKTINLYQQIKERP